MPWKETNVLEERMKFISDWLSGDYTMSELCRAYGVSRETGYEWRRRYEDLGLEGLKDRSSAPHRHPNAVGGAEVVQIVDLRKKHPTWGPKKLKARLERLHPRRQWPAESTIGEILDRHGLTQPRIRRRHVPPNGSPLSACDAANSVWGVDFKGWFRTHNGDRCNPLSLSDLTSRYVLRLDCVDKYDTTDAWRVLDSAFREFGLPDRLRSDNGVPFASTAVGGLSPLSIRLIKAGVTPERIQPGKPQQNGRHERMHLTLLQDTATPPAATLAAQQKRFDNFRHSFNYERPHEALGFATPADCYSQSLRRFTGKLKEPEYPGGIEVRRVRYCGTIKWKGEQLFLTQSLHLEPVGIEQVSSSMWAVKYGPLLLGYIDDSKKFHRLKSGVHPRLEAKPTSG